jgi:hypothetical protein
MRTKNTPDIATRFWSRVDCATTPNGCWVWTAGKFRGGYGAITIDGKVRKAHRIAWQLANGAIPDGIFVCHSCDNPSCVRPDHLFLGTPADNMHDRDAKGRTCRTPGSQRWSAKVNEAIVLEIRARYVPRKVTLQFLADEYGLSFQMVSLIVNRKNWTHI